MLPPRLLAFVHPVYPGLLSHGSQISTRPSARPRSGNLRDGLASAVRRETAGLLIDVEGAELRILVAAAGVLRSHGPILFYEFFNHRAEILALLKVYGSLVFESDRHQVIKPETIDFIAVPNDYASVVTSALAALGYPISPPRG